MRRNAEWRRSASSYRFTVRNPRCAAAVDPGHRRVLGIDDSTPDIAPGKGAAHRGPRGNESPRDRRSAALESAIARGVPDAEAKSAHEVDEVRPPTRLQVCTQNCQ